MIKHVPILLIIVGVVVLMLGIILVIDYGLSFLTGIALFFGIAMLIAGVDLTRKIKKLKKKNVTKLRLMIMLKNKLYQN